jgi:enoyl-CoA hydratase
MPRIDVDSYEHVRLRKEGPILRATITNPTKKNAVNAGVAGDLNRLWRDTPGTMPGRSKASAKGIRDRIWDILDCETPTIAKVRGPAYGMGANIALACDFVVAADDARFCDSHVKNGITPATAVCRSFPSSSVSDARRKC